MTTNQPLLPILLCLLIVSCGPPPEQEVLFHQPEDCAQRLEALHALLDQVDSLKDLTGQIDTALLRIKDCRVDSTNEQVADAYRRLGVYYYDNTLNDTARRYYQLGLDRHPSREMQGRLYCNYGLSYHSEGAFFQALPYFDSALVMADTDPFRLFVVRAATYIGDAYERLHHIEVAERYLSDAQGWCDSLPEPSRASFLAEVHEVQSSCRRVRQRYAAAIEQGRQGIRLLGDPSLLSPYDHRTYINCCLNIGTAWQDSMLKCPVNSPQRQQAGDSAVYYTQKALNLYRLSKNVEGERVTLVNLGELYRRQNNPEAARNLLTAAIQQVKTAAIQQVKPDTTWKLAYDLRLAQYYLNRGEACLDARDWESAAADFDSSLYYLLPGFTPGAGLTTPAFDQPVAKPTTLLMVLQDIMRVRYQSASAKGASQKDDAGVSQVIDTLLAVADRTRQQYWTEQAKIHLWQDLRPYLDSAFRFTVNLYESSGDEGFLERAFQIAEQGKAMALLEAVRGHRGRESWPKALQDRDSELLAERNAINEQAHLLRHDKAKQEKLRGRWQTYMANWRLHQNELDSLKLRSAEDTNRPTQLLRRDLIDVDQALLEYLTLDSTLFVFLLQRDTLMLRKVPLDSTFARDVARMDLILTSQDSFSDLREKQQVYSQLTYRLYTTLFPNFGQPLPRRLILVPDDPFRTLPFEALWTRPQPGGFLQNEDHDGYLLYQHAISYAYSSNLLWEMNQGRKRTSTQRQPMVAAFAPHFHQPLVQGEQTLLKPVAQALQALIPLPNRKEIREIKQHVPVKPFVKKQATREQFLAACRQYSAVHIATHGILNDEEPLFNFISFSQLRGEVNPEEFLYLQDLYTEELDLELAVFSACETARGALIKGEGNMSMARGLAGAGVQSIVTTLWSVNPYHTVRLMPLFYEELGADGGLPKDVALAQAKRRFIKMTANHLDPASWAGAILIGGSAPLRLAVVPDRRLSAAWYLVLVLIVPLLWWTRRRARRPT